MEMTETVSGCFFLNTVYIFIHQGGSHYKHKQ